VSLNKVLELKWKLKKSSRLYSLIGYYQCNSIGETKYTAKNPCLIQYLYLFFFFLNNNKLSYIKHS